MLKADSVAVSEFKMNRAGRVVGPMTRQTAVWMPDSTDEEKKKRIF